MTELAEAGNYFWWLITCVWDVALHFWPISVAVLLVATAALVLRKPFREPRFRKTLGKLAVAYVLPAVVLLIGTVLRYEHDPGSSTWQEPPSWYGYLLWGPVVIYFVVLVGSAAFLKGLRLRSTGILLPGLWLSLCALLPAASSVSGVWP